MSKQKLEVLRIDADDDLQVPEWVPPQLAKLANDLYSYVDHDDLVLVLEGAQRAGAVTTFVVDLAEMDLAETLPAPKSPFPLNDLLMLTFPQATTRTLELVDYWLVNPDSVAPFPASFIATYGLLRLDRSFAKPVDESRLLDAACVAGRCLGKAAFITGLDQGGQVALSGKAKKAAKEHWKGLIALRNETVAKYKGRQWPSKAEFIRQHQAHVLAEAKRMKYSMTADSVAKRIRQWINEDSQ